MLHFSVRNNDKFVKIVSVKHGEISITPVIIHPFFGAYKANIMQFIFSNVWKSLICHKKHLAFFFSTSIANFQGFVKYFYAIGKNHKYLIKNSKTG